MRLLKWAHVESFKVEFWDEPHAMTREAEILVATDISDKIYIELTKIGAHVNILSDNIQR